MKEYDVAEMIWKKRFDKLKSEVTTLAEKAEMEVGPFECPPERAFMQSRRIFVNFDYHVVDSEEYAKDNWGEGNYDVYDLNKTLSPFDQESEDYYTKKTGVTGVTNVTVDSEGTT